MRMMKMSEITLDDVVRASIALMEKELPPEEVKELYAGIKQAFETILHPTRKAKASAESLGVVLEERNNIDDWSLNNQKNKPLSLSSSCDYEIHVYTAGAIETLRQKLIDDIYDFIDDITIVSRPILIKQINKRFGYLEIKE